MPDSASLSSVLTKLKFCIKKHLSKHYALLVFDIKRKQRLHKDKLNGILGSARLRAVINKRCLHYDTGNYTLYSARLRYKLKTKFAQRSMEWNSRLYPSKISDQK